MKKIVVLLAALLVAAPVFAGNTGYVKLSLWDNIAVAVPNNIHNITGLDLGIGSKADTVDGVQFDFIYGDAHKVRGVKFGLVDTADIVYGIQGGLVTINRQDMRGIQGGLVSINNGKMQGLQDGYINWSDGQVIGVQWGLVNVANRMTGVQFGLVNYAKQLENGLQLGLVNIAKNGWLPVMIIVNGRF